MMVNSGGTDGRTGGTYLRYAEREKKKGEKRENEMGRKQNQQYHQSVIIMIDYDVKL